MTTCYKFRIFCLTDNRWEHVLYEDNILPSKCPINTNHDVNLNSVSLVEKISNNQIEIMEEFPTPYQPSTNKHFRLKSYLLTTPPKETSYIDITWPIPVTILSAWFIGESEHNNDLLSAEYEPDAIIGVLTQPVNVGDKKMYVSSTVTTYMDPGYYLKLDANTFNDDMGQITEINKNAGSVIMEYESTHYYPVGTLIRFKLVMIDMFIIRHVKVEIGNSTIRGAYIPVNKRIRLIYKNNDETETKMLPVHFEILY